MREPSTTWATRCAALDARMHAVCHVGIGPNQRCRRRAVFLEALMYVWCSTKSRRDGIALLCRAALNCSFPFRTRAVARSFLTPFHGPL